jgi:hypothetical protein
MDHLTRPHGVQARAGVEFILDRIHFRGRRVSARDRNRPRAVSHRHRAGRIASHGFSRQLGHFVQELLDVLSIHQRILQPLEICWNVFRRHRRIHPIQVSLTHLRSGHQLPGAGRVNGRAGLPRPVRERAGLVRRGSGRLRLDHAAVGRPSGQNTLRPVIRARQARVMLGDDGPEHLDGAARRGGLPGLPAARQTRLSRAISLGDRPGRPGPRGRADRVVRSPARVYTRAYTGSFKDLR